MVRRISARVVLPLLAPKASQASDSGARLAWANTPPPAIAFHGALSLNRNRSPGWSALKVPVPAGCQKLTSPEPSPER